MMNADPKRVTVVLAADGPFDIASSSIEGFVREVEGRGEVIVVGQGAGDALVPELWAEGIAASDAPFVALSTTRMIPAPGWLDAMLGRLDETGASGVGGPILPGPALSPFDNALYLQRWVNYGVPLPPEGLAGPPGENAVYRRECLQALRPFWAKGFWEVEVQGRIRERGGRLETAADAPVVYLGGAAPAGTLVRRFRHARRHGSGRAEGRSWPSRLLRVAAAPAVPPVILARSLRGLTVRNRPVGPWAPALPALALILTAWAAGEAIGTLLGPGSGPFPRPASPVLRLACSTTESAEAVLS